MLAFYDTAGQPACAACTGHRAVYACVQCGGEDSPYGAVCGRCTLTRRVTEPVSYTHLTLPTNREV